MSQAAEARRLPSAPEIGRGLWARQVRAVMALELRKNLLGKWAFLMYFLACLPVLFFVIRAVIPVIAQVSGSELKLDNMGAASQLYSIVFQTFVLRLVIFLGCVGVFTNLFRGEMVDRSLHYYLLSPVRRDVLTAAKYLSGVVATGVVFSVMTVASYLLLYAPSPGAFGSYFLGGPGLSHLLTYASLTWLACLGYGAVFMVLGLVFRNPIIPAAFIFGWEWINSLLPSLLKKISIVHYLFNLAPVPVDMGPFALVGEPTSAWVAVPGLLLVCAALLGASAALSRKLEIRYDND